MTAFTTPELGFIVSETRKHQEYVLNKPKHPRPERHPGRWNAFSTRLANILQTVATKLEPERSSRTDPVAE